MLAALLALLAAASNAVASVLQRYAARQVPSSKSFRLALILDLVRNPVWLAGFVGVIAGAVFQSGALMAGRFALVQPILIIELPFTLLVAAFVFRQRPGRRPILATLAMTGGLALMLLAAAPSGGRPAAPIGVWVLASAGSGGAVLLLVLAGIRARRAAVRAALIGAAAAIGFAFTAALIKDATGQLSAGVGALLTSWQLYTLMATGAMSLFLLQNALQAGPLVVTAPVLTLADSPVSVLYGVTIFDESIRLGGWLIPELVGLALIVGGSVELARMPLVSGTKAGTQPGSEVASESRADPEAGLPVAQSGA